MIVLCWNAVGGMLAAFLVIGDIGVEGCQFVPIQHDDFLVSM